ncbi:SDR family NAD(P)-dependent oxidoreductase [Arcobacter sp. YIC-464]|uniref:SDR family NAD(P)-dependent oxidoreductase n=1 Tax=Arcobacter sp. YIC-464 TaxID=3376631 RepID=UPI003C294EA0
MSKNIWIIGASSGIGYELTKLYLQNGYIVVASSRNAKESYELNSLKLAFKQTLFIKSIDVEDKNSIINAINYVWSKLNYLDVCIFNAGVYESTSLNSLDIEKFEEMININYLGAVRLTDIITSKFENQGFGKLVLNASLSSYFGLPNAAAYGASKAALVSFAQAIQPELIRKNIELQIINHGFVKTRLTNKNDFEMPQLMTSNYAALKIFHELNKSYRFEIKFPFKLSFFLYLLKILPYKVSLAITKGLLK